MTTKTFDAPVLVDELILRAGGSAEAADTWLRKLRVEVTTDWAGRAVIRATDAERVVQAHQRAQAEHAEAVSAYDHYLRDRTRRLVEAGDDAYREVAERELRNQYSAKFTDGGGQGWAEGGVTTTNALTLWPRGRAMAREASLEAHRRFEEREPLVRFREWMERRGK